MNDDQLLRYSRHILLDEIGIEGQERLLAAHVLIIGAGGLGCPAALYLGSAGVGQITLIDHDNVDMSNLQRQIAHTMAGVGTSKVESLAKAVHAINPEVKINCLQRRATETLLNELVPQATVVLDCTDNYQTRQLINAICVRHKTPLIEGAAIRLDGQLMVIDPRETDAPCYACVFDPEAEFQETQCSTMGVLAPLVGVIGTMQAAQALKLITGFGKSSSSQLQMLDARTMEWSCIRVTHNPDCPVCRRNL